MAINISFIFFLIVGFFVNKINSNAIPIHVDGDSKKNKTLERIKNINTI
jgi:hypothetical protein